MTVTHKAKARKQANKVWKLGKIEGVMEETKEKEVSMETAMLSVRAPMDTCPPLLWRVLEGKWITVKV